MNGKHFNDKCIESYIVINLRFRSCFTSLDVFSIAKLFYITGLTSILHVVYG